LSFFVVGKEGKIMPKTRGESIFFTAITANFIPDYLVTYCRNFIMAFPLQLIIVGPPARLIFRTFILHNPL